MQEKEKQPPFILYAEDDDDDFLLVKDAFTESGFKGELCRVKNGEQLMETLLGGPGAVTKIDPKRPMIILLDLNMPRKDGREALKEIKSNADLRRIPVVIVTTSRAEEDVYHTYDMGANAFVRKPIHFDKFVEIARLVEKHWFETVILPSN